MEMTMIGPYNPTPAEREVMENIAAESQAAPDSEFRYFVYNPLDKTTHYYRSEAVQQRAAAAILRSCCVDGDWDEAAVAQIAMGVVTHKPNRSRRITPTLPPTPRHMTLGKRIAMNTVRCGPTACCRWPHRAQDMKAGRTPSVSSKQLFGDR